MTFAKLLENPKLAAVVASAAVLVVGALGWFLLVSPERSRASDLGAQISDTQSQILARTAAAHPRLPGGLTAKDVPRLRAALPDLPEIPELLRNVSRIAAGSGVVFDAITPQAPVAATGYDALPMEIDVDGRFFAVRDFLRQLRQQVEIVNRKVRASGRLYEIQSLDLESTEPAPQITAKLTLQAFVFKSAPPAPAAAPSTPTGASAAGPTG